VVRRRPIWSANRPNISEPSGRPTSVATKISELTMARLSGDTEAGRK